MKTFTPRALQIAGALILAAGATAVQAGAREEAKMIHDRIAGVPPSEAVLLDMAADIDAGNVVAAANTAMENEGFYAVTLKNLFMPATNRDGDVFRDFNDYVATVIGIVRDGKDFRTALYDNIIYVGDPSLGLPAYANNNNNHYAQLYASGASLKDNLVERTQTQVTGLEAEATAGLMTTRAAAKAFFIAGTNRAMFRFTLMNHLCMDLEQVHDITRTPDRIRQDVSRSPGGDSRVFNNNCIGCHSGMDPLAQAFAYYNYQYDADNDLTGENGQLVYNSAGETDPETGTRVQAKYHINSTTFPNGFVTPDDKWDNYWRAGQNQLLGWDQTLPGSGNGAKTMGMELAHSDAFAQCQVKRVFKTVCLREPGNAADRTAVSDMVTSFKSGGYQLKQVFAESADYCLSSN
ncbi:hypothetical protein [Simiduia agarivorans]|uniref:DUF1585 domain-containing protein n=1 Tax=Simiduia agarivorans (strain DSM 21679 / JCM 13881 / BCRC 17597 / SA1) TaxID=1117647 RepID=K4KKP8_SIMAS|nr:hypothetical protein [Simiduia agarivorans]AFU99596.1 hypothetical protein M5M_12180 [Simiduia agarivorans SA1 = DSM 21679]